MSTYAGAGGMDLGFALAGFRPVWVNEMDPAALATNEAAMDHLARSMPHVGAHRQSHVGDVLSIPAGAFPPQGSVDLVIGGPPCQGFSVAGLMRPDDPRSQHVHHFLDIVDAVRPAAFVMENVKALHESHRWVGVRSRLMERSAQLGYTSKAFVCNASEFGVPQARYRMFLVGVRDAAPLPPIPTTPGDPPTLRQALALLPPFGTPGNDDLCRAKITPSRKPVLRRSPYAGLLLNGPGRVLDLDAPAPTLLASMGGNATPRH